MPTDLLAKLHHEWPVIQAAPYSFATAVVLVSAIISTVIYFLFRTRLASLNGRIKLLRDQRDHYKSKFDETADKEAQSSAEPVLAPDCASDQASGKLERAALVRSARQLAVNLVHTNPDGFADSLERTTIYYRIRPWLSQQFLKQMRQRGSTVIIPANEGSIPPLADLFLHEVDRLEREWGLR